MYACSVLYLCVFHCISVALMCPNSHPYILIFCNPMGLNLSMGFPFWPQYYVAILSILSRKVFFQPKWKLWSLLQSTNSSAFPVYVLFQSLSILWPFSLSFLLQLVAVCLHKNPVPAATASSQRKYPAETHVVDYITWWRNITLLMIEPDIFHSRTDKREHVKGSEPDIIFFP